MTIKIKDKDIENKTFTVRCSTDQKTTAVDISVNNKQLIY